MDVSRPPHVRVTCSRVQVDGPSGRFTYMVICSRHRSSKPSRFPPHKHTQVNTTPPLFLDVTQLSPTICGWPQVSSASQSIPAPYLVLSTQSSYTSLETHSTPPDIKLEPDAPLSPGLVTPNLPVTHPEPSHLTPPCIWRTPPPPRRGLECAGELEAQESH